MNAWKDEQLTALESAVAEYFKIMNASKREALTDKEVQLSILEFMRDNYGVSVSIGWLANIFYRGAQTIQNSSWLTVQSFMAAMNDPRITGHALQRRQPSLYIESKSKPIRKATGAVTGVTM